jgi:molybdopterin molybdotransferase
MIVKDVCAEPQSQLLTLEQAQARISQAVRSIEASEWMSLKQAHGRILAENLHAPSDIPAYASSSMDGYAIRSQDLQYRRRLQVVGTAWAGNPYSKPLGFCECVRIFTGAPIPEQADTVIPQEEVQRTEHEIFIGSTTIAAGAYIRPCGDEALEEDLLLSAGQRLTPEAIGLIASIGHPEVLVKSKPRIAFFATGNELCSIDQQPVFGQVYESNRYTLWSLLTELGAEPIDLGVIRDDREAIKKTLWDAAEQADAIITTGGASVGEADLMAAVLLEIGQIDFWKVALKPGKPFLFGRLQQTLFFGLPGNPVSTLVTFKQLVRPGLMKMMGMPPSPPLRFKATCTHRLNKTPGRLEFQRGVYRTNETGDLIVTGLAKQGAHHLTSMVSANCFIVLPIENSGVDSGQLVTIEPF